MKTKLFFPILLFCLFIFSKINGQNYHVLIDPNFSSISSAESIVSVHRAITSLEDKYFPLSIGKPHHPKWFKKTSSIFYRTVKWNFYDLPLHFLIMMVQDEVFGKGYQYRILDFSKNKYGISAPAPYGNNYSFTNRGSLDSDRVLGLDEELGLYFGGNNATWILSNTIAKKWFSTNTIHFKDAMFYSIMRFRSVYPILMRKWSGRRQNINSYLSRINRLNGLTLPSDDPYNSKKLSKRARINLLNPFFLQTLYAGFVDYGWFGKRYGKLRWLKIANIHFLPSFRLGLTPFGDEIYFETYSKKEKHTVRIYYRHGNPFFHKHNGFGFETINVFNWDDKLRFDFQMDVWNQPSIQLGGDEVRITQAGIGTLMKTNFQIRLWTKPRPLYLAGQIGFKTDGYVEGEPLHEGVIIRYGMAFDF